MSEPAGNKLDGKITASPSSKGLSGRQNADLPKEPQREEEYDTVFISYSWDNEAHKRWVLELANKLVENGIDVILDQYELRLGKNLTYFMDNSIDKADKIILICTENYKIKAEGRAGGVGYEYSMINENLYKNQINNNRVIPILRAGTAKNGIPNFVKSFIWLDMSDNHKFDETFEVLLREIYNEPEVKKPKLGKRPVFKSSSFPEEQMIEEAKGDNLEGFPWLVKTPYFLETFDASNAESIAFQDYQEDGWSGKAERGIYKLENQEDQFAVKYHYLNLNDQDMSGFPVSIEVKVNSANDYPTPSAGLIFCFDENTRFYYAFILSNEKEYKLWLKGEGGYKTVISGRSNQIYPNEFNKIGVIRSGESIYLFINNHCERRVIDNALATGDSGIIAVGKGAFCFDNLTFYKP